MTIPGKTGNMLEIQTADVKLGFDALSGRLVSFRPEAAPDQEFIASAPDHPVFVVKVMDVDRQIVDMSSLQAEQIEIRRDGNSVVMVFSRLNGFDLSVTMTVSASADDLLSRWSLTLTNRTGREIVSVQFPFVVVPYIPGGTTDETALLLPHGNGSLIRNPLPESIGPDHSRAWNMEPGNGPTSHYPGSIFAQFMAYYNRRAGVYLACQDTEGHVKLMKALHRAPGIRLGVTHVGDWPRDGSRTLEYEVVLGAFTGDWYAAADIYREWSLRQKWAVPLSRRTDVPVWLLDSPPHITIRPQGLLDEGPIFPVEEFLPYPKSIPLLAKIADRVDAPLVAVIMGWERGGSWVYPDCFPPIGGDDSVTEFATMARERGWHVGSFCNGTRWVTAHTWNDYDGRAYYEEQNGIESVCRTPEGTPWSTDWSWRRAYSCCMGAPKTREIAAHFVRRLIDWGLESIQFFDQNVGAATFACYASDHEHPPVPGQWMPRKMEETIGLFRDAAREAGEEGVIQSVEQPCNEFCLPLFQQCDVRVEPPSSGRGDFVPLYHYLFHECIIMHGMMGLGPEPYHLPIRNAMNGVLGEIPGAVMIGDGTLLNKNTPNWAPWEPRVGSDDDALEMIRTVTAMRRGPGRDFLVFGRMLAPSRITGIDVVRWEYGKQVREVPAVFHAAWRTPDGDFGIVLANWTTEERIADIAEPRLGDKADIHVCGRQQEHRTQAGTDGVVAVTLPPLSCVLVAGQ